MAIRKTRKVLQGNPMAAADIVKQELAGLPPPDKLPFQEPFSILSVDDDSIHLQVVNKLLASHNYQVREARDVAEATLDIRTNGLPSLILLDVMMPDTSGQELLRALRQNYGPELMPIVMVSAKGNKDTIASCLETGANDYVQKPFQKKELLERIRFQLKLSQKARQTQRANRITDTPKEAYSAEGQATPLDASAEAASWFGTSVKELKMVREERDKAIQEADDLRQRLRQIEEEARQNQVKGEEQQRLMSDFFKRQQALVAHQDQLASCVENLEGIQNLQRQLVSVTGAELQRAQTPTFLASLAAGGHFLDGPVNESLRELHMAEESLHGILSRMAELSNSLLPGEAKDEMQGLMNILRKDMGKVIMDTARKHYLLLDAQCKLQDQMLQLQRITMPPKTFLTQQRMQTRGSSNAGPFFDAATRS